MNTTGQTSASVGANTETEAIGGDNTFGVMNSGGGTPTFGLTDIVDALVAAGAMAGTTPLTLSNFEVTEIDVILRPIGGHVYDISLGSKLTATESDAQLTNNGTTTNLDPGGRREGLRPQSDFSVSIKEGSAVLFVVEYELI